MTSQPDSAGVQFRSVLVPLDGSELALAALPTARALAERFGAELHVVSASQSGDDVDRLAALGAAALDVPPGDARVAVVRSDDAAEAIARRAQDLGDCLICASTHGRGRFSGALIGSVTRSLAQRSTSPLVVLGPNADRPGWTPQLRWPPPLSVARIVACVDGSADSEVVLPAATAWARALDMSLTIVTVVEDVPPPLRLEQQQTSYGPAGEPQTYLDELVGTYAGSAVQVTGRVVHDPISAASGIRTYLDKEPAGLVALTSHSRTGMERMYFGSAAANIIRASVAPCLVVPLPSEPPPS